jgi:hypothetical protein
MTIWMTNSRPGCSPEPQSAGEALLLAQVSGTVENGSNGGNLLLNVPPDTGDDEDEDDADEGLFGNEGQPQGYSEFRNFSTDEIASLERCLTLLKQGGNLDPKLEAILGYMLGTNPNATEPWVNRGCILFSQYYDTARWVGEQHVKEDLGFIPSFADWVKAIRPEPWMGRAVRIEALVDPHLASPVVEVT